MRAKLMRLIEFVNLQKMFENKKMKKFKDVHLDCKRGVCSDTVKSFFTPQTIDACANYLYQTVWQNIDRKIESERNELIAWFVQQDWFFQCKLHHNRYIEHAGSFELVLLYLERVVATNEYIDWMTILLREFTVEQTKQLLQINQKTIWLYKTTFSKFRGEKLDWIFYRTIWDSYNKYFIVQWDQTNVNHLMHKVFLLDEPDCKRMYEMHREHIEIEIAHADKDELIDVISSTFSIQKILKIVPTFCKQHCFELFLDAYENQNDDYLFYLWDTFEELKTKPLLCGSKDIEIIRATDNLQECVEQFEKKLETKVELRWKQVEAVDPQSLNIQVCEIPYFAICKNGKIDTFVNWYGMVGDFCVFLSFYYSLRDSLRRIQWKMQNQILLDIEMIKYLFLNHCHAQTKESARIALWMVPILLPFESIIHQGFMAASNSKWGHVIVDEIQKHYSFPCRPLPTDSSNDGTFGG